MRDNIKAPVQSMLSIFKQPCIGIYNNLYLVMLFACNIFLSVSRSTMVFAVTKILIGRNLTFSCFPGVDEICFYR